MSCIHFPPARSFNHVPIQNKAARFLACEKKKLLLEKRWPTQTAVVTWLDLKQMFDKGREKGEGEQAEKDCAAQLSHRPFPQILNGGSLSVYSKQSRQKISRCL